MPSPRQSFTDSAGLPLANGMVFTYAAGTSTPLAAFQDAAGLIPHKNPIRLDARGEATVYFIGNYKIDLKTATGKQVTGYPVDNFQSPADVTADNGTTKVKGSWFGGVVGYVSDLGTRVGASLMGLAQGGSVQDAIKFVTPEMFVAVSDILRLNAAAAYADTNNVEMRLNDHGTHYDLAGGTFLLPRRFSGHVRTGSDFRGHLLQNGTVILRTKSTPDVRGIDATVFRCEGLQKGRVHKVRVDSFILDGYSTDWGIFWTDFADISAGVTTLDISRFAVNSCTFRNIVSGIPTGYGIDITDGTNTGPTFYECHGNVFVACDVAHSRGYMNRSNLNQANTILGGYAEDITTGYKPVSGNWNIDGMNSDSGGIPSVGMYNHIFGMTTQSERTGGDVLSMPEKSIVSLDWSARDSTGKPPALSGSGTVVADAAMPGGSRARFGATTATAFANVTVTIPAFYSYGAYPRFVLTGYWYGDLPASIEVNNGDGTPSTYSTEGFVDLTGGYYLFRITGYASTAASTTVRFFITTSAVSRTGYIGACHVSPYKAAPLPYRPAISAGGSVMSADIAGMVLQRGVANQAYTNTSPATLAVTFPAPFAAVPTVTLAAIPAATYAGKLTGYEIVTGSITVSGFSVRLAFSPDWAGDINWLAIG